MKGQIRTASSRNTNSSRERRDFVILCSLVSLTLASISARPSGSEAATNAKSGSRSCREELVRGAEELVVDAVGRHARAGQAADQGAQEGLGAAQEVVRLPHRRVPLQPADADQA